MSFNNNIAEIFKTLANLSDTNEQEKLEKKVKNYTIETWRREKILQAVGAGAISGIIPVASGRYQCQEIATILLADLTWCMRVGTLGCFGIGHILEREIDYDLDMALIIAIWAELAEASVTVPVGKVGIKLSSKVLPKVAEKLAGKIIAKASLKGSSKVLIQTILPQATSKIVAKLAAKTGTAWIPFIGSAVSGGINWWLVSSLLDAAEKYYRNDYVVLPEELMDFQLQ